MIIDLGLVDYEECYAIQKELVAKRRLGLIDESLIVAEHNPVFTVGRSGSIENLLADESELLARGIKVLRVDRGGDITFHGPGQIVVYPIVDLKRRGRDLHIYMRDLEEAVINFLKAYSVASNRIPGRTGVWVGQAKIAFIGVASSGWVTYHGLSVNIDVDRSYFSMINPCGLKGLTVTGLKEVLGRPVDISQVRNDLIEECSRIFGVDKDDYAYETASTLA